MEQKFILVRILLALGIVCIVWSYALPGELPSQPQDHLYVMRDNFAQNVQSKAQTTDISEILKKTAATGNSKMYLFFLAFLAGILISFTPCVYPMIPITVGILHTQASQSLTYNFFSALTYVGGIATVYASLGYFAATASVLFGQWVANPWIIGFIILFFLYLAFSMFGFYPLYIPGFLERRDNVNVRGSLLRTFMFGLISGTVASPCLTPGLAVLLTIVAKEANPLVGFLTMFFFSLGMGILLILIGTFSGALAMLPRAGEWMIEVERAMGFMMLGVSIYFLQPLMSRNSTLYLYAALLFGAAVYYFFEPRKNYITFIVGSLLTLIAAYLLWVLFKL